MEKEEMIQILENHLRILAEKAKESCSGEDLKAITEAMKITVELI